VTRITGVAADADVSSAVFLERAWDEVLEFFCASEVIANAKIKISTEFEFFLRIVIVNFFPSFIILK
jgi:hypothetical protein